MRMFVFSWQQMQEGLANYRARLASSLEVHGFKRDVDEIKERIIEKVRNETHSASLKTYYEQTQYFVSLYNAVITSRYRAHLGTEHI